MTKSTKARLVKRLLSRLVGLDVPVEVIRPSILDLAIRGKLLIITWHRKEPCSCKMCGGHHSKVLAVAIPHTSRPLKELFNNKVLKW